MALPQAGDWASFSPEVPRPNFVYDSVIQWAFALLLGVSLFSFPVFSEKCMTTLCILWKKRGSLAH